MYNYINPPKIFDHKYFESLEYEDRLKYLDVTVRKDKVIEFQIANAKSLSTENYMRIPGCVSKKKDLSILYINTDTGQAHFVNDRTIKWITTVVKEERNLMKFAKNGFQLLLNLSK